MSSIPPFIVALDLSKTRTGVCIGFAGKTPRFGSLVGAGKKDPAVLKKVMMYLIDVNRMQKIDHLGYEAMVNPHAFKGEWNEQKQAVESKTNPMTTITLAKIVGVVQCFCAMQGLDDVPANVQSIRAQFLGKGYAQATYPKERALAMCKALGWDPSNEDEADAGAAWYWLCARLAPKFYEPIFPHIQAAVHLKFDKKPAFSIEEAFGNV